VRLVSGNAVIASLALSLQAFAAHATIYQGYVTNVTAANGMIYVLISNGTFGTGGQGNCPTGSAMAYAISVSPSASDFNRALIAIALSAKTTGLQVYASGDGNCANGNPYSGGGSEGLSVLDFKG
jgi:hypothetical protein